jgi:uncharacterized protein (TIGR02270 family)
MLSPKVVLLRDVLEEHFEELQFLWGLRRDSLRSPELTLPKVRRIESRMEAHADGLLLARGELPALVGEGLSSDDPLVSFAAGYVLLRSGVPGAAASVVEAFRRSAGGCREGLCDALAHGDIREVSGELADCMKSGDAGLAVSAATALALQRPPGAPDLQDSRFREDADAAVRAAGWRLVPLLPSPPRPEAFRRGLSDPEAAVAREAAVAAAWFAVPAALEACRENAQAGREDAAEWLHLLAVLGEPVDLAVVSGAAAGGLGYGRSGPRALGALGHPGGVGALLEAMDSEDPERASAAGSAFTKITGIDVASDRRATARPTGETPDDFEEEFLEEVVLPDATAARAFWKDARPSFAKGTRWCRGADVTSGCPVELLEAIDMESRWEACLRGRFSGTWKGTASELVRLVPERD